MIEKSEMAKELSEELKEEIRNKFCEPGHWDNMIIESLALEYDLPKSVIREVIDSDETVTIAIKNRWRFFFQLIIDSVGKEEICKTFGISRMRLQEILSKVGLNKDYHKNGVIKENKEGLK